MTGIKKETVLVIGDSHDSPKMSKDRFFWIGKFCAELKPDILIHIGDISSFDSLCHFIPDDTYTAKVTKPLYQEDMDSLQKCLQELDRGMGKFNVRKILTEGNHENRLHKYADKNPPVFGMLQEKFYELMESFNWKCIEYAKMFEFGGVNFCHCPKNSMGREYGGINAERKIATESSKDLVFGHSHRFQDIRVPVLGSPLEYRRVVNVGSSMPYGHIEEYAKHNLSGWTWLITELRIWDNHIQEVNSISMQTLEERYKQRRLN